MKKNLGPTERILRLLLGGVAIAVALHQPHVEFSEMIVATAGLFLMLNAVSARCYLWHWLGIDTSTGKQCDLKRGSD